MTIAVQQIIQHLLQSPWDGTSAGPCARRLCHRSLNCARISPENKWDCCCWENGLGGCFSCSTAQHAQPAGAVQREPRGQALGWRDALGRAQTDMEYPLLLISPQKAARSQENGRTENKIGAFHLLSPPGQLRAACVLGRADGGIAESALGVFLLSLSSRAAHGAV